VRWDDLTEGAQVMAVFAYNVAQTAGIAAEEDGERKKRQISRETPSCELSSRELAARGYVEGRVTGEIGAGLMILLGVGREDSAVVAASLAEKVGKPADFRR